MVPASVVKQPEMPIGRRSQQIGISETTTWPILRKDFAVKTCKV